jgi:hypothetical protein
MRNQLRLVAAFDVLNKRINRTLVYSVIAIIGFIACNISVSPAQTVDPGFSPCVDGHINAPAQCVRTATCTTGSWLYATRVVVITGTFGSSTACPGYNVYNGAYIHLLSNNMGLTGGAAAHFGDATGIVMSYAYGHATCAGTKHKTERVVYRCPDNSMTGDTSSSQDSQCNQQNCPAGFSFSSNRCACVNDSNPPPADMPL